MVGQKNPSNTKIQISIVQSQKVWSVKESVWSLTALEHKGTLNHVLTSYNALGKEANTKLTRSALAAKLRGHSITLRSRKKSYLLPKQ